MLHGEAESLANRLHHHHRGSEEEAQNYSHYSQLTRKMWVLCLIVHRSEVLHVLYWGSPSNSAQRSFLCSILARMEVISEYNTQELSLVRHSDWMPVTSWEQLAARENKRKDEKNDFSGLSLVQKAFVEAAPMTPTLCPFTLFVGGVSESVCA